MKSLIEAGRIARKCLPDTGPALVNHKAINEAGAYISALTYFKDAVCPQGFISAVLNDKGEWRDFCKDESDIYQLSPEELDKKLRDCFDSVYGLANGSLDHIFDQGFNRHDNEHIDRVTAATIKLLREAGTTIKLLREAEKPEDVIRRGVAAARGHDLGNPLSRRIHSLLSPKIFERVVEQVIDDPEQWRIIRRAMQLHNEPVASALIRSWGENLTEIQIIEKMRKDFGPEALALIIADKTDISRKRVSEKPTDGRTVDKDQHLEVNLLGETKSLVLSKDKTVFTWNLQFTPGMSKEEQDTDPRYVEASGVQNGGLKARVSERTHRLHSEFNIPHFDVWKSLFWSLYYERIILTVRAAFALYPDLKKFVILVKDQSPANEKSKVTFKRDTLAETFELQKIKYALHKQE